MEKLEHQTDEDLRTWLSRATSQVDPAGLPRDRLVLELCKCIAAGQFNALGEMIPTKGT